MFQKFQLWLQTDPQAKKKILFIGGVVAIVSVLFYFIYFLNFGLEKEPATLPNPQPISTAQEINQNTFENSKGLKLLSQNSLGLSQRVFFDPQDNSPVYVNESLILTVNQRVITKSPEFILRTASFNTREIILNDDSSSTVYFKASDQFIKLPENVSFLTQLNPNQFIFLDQTSGLKIMETNNFGNTPNAQLFVEVKPQIDYESLELRVFKNRAYLFLFENQNRLGRVEIWSITKNQSQKIQTLENVDSLKFSQLGILFTQNLGTNNSVTSILDLSGETSQTENFQIQNNLLENRVTGQMIAERCDLKPDKSEILCLIKENSPDYFKPTDKDVLVKIDTATKTISLPNRDLIFSGETIHFDTQGGMYLVSQELRQLYKAEI